MSRATDITKFVARLPEDLHEEIKETARQNNRSMNSEIIQRLRGNAERELSLRLHIEGNPDALQNMRERLKSSKTDVQLLLGRA